MRGQNEISRRQFIGKSAKVAAGVGAGILGVPAANVLGANETLRVGVVGPGRRGYSMMRIINEIPNVEIVAVCDIFEGWLKRGAEKAREKAKRVAEYDLYEKLLEAKDIDALVIATPEHVHAQHTIDAIQAGFDVYIEKPMCHTWEEAKEVAAVAEQSDRIVQVGTQRRSIDIYHRAREIVQSGKLGKITQVRAYWFRNSKDNKPQWRYPIPEDASEKNINWRVFLGPAPYKPFSLNRYFQWRCYWDYSNGIASDLMVHQVDIINMIMGSSLPKAVMGMGQMFRWTQSDRETPDTWNAILEYPPSPGSASGHVVNYSSIFSNEHFGCAEEFLGSDATLVVNGELKVYAEKHRMQEVEELSMPAETTKPGPHLENFFDCVRTRKQPNCDATQGFHATAAARMAVLSHFSGKKLMWDRTRQEVITRA